MIKRRYGGDTIIEVLLAVTLFSVVAVSTMMLMNRGVSVAQQSLETTLVRQQIDAQADMLRFMHDRARSDEQKYVEAWNDTPISDGIDENLAVDNCKDQFSPDGFVLYTSGSGIKVNKSNYAPAEVYAKVDEDGKAQGIDVQIIRTANGRAYDAYIQACWDTPASDKPMTIGTIVRLYDPSVN